MKHIKTLNTKNLKDTMKKVDVANARLHVNPLAKHPVL